MESRAEPESFGHHGTAEGGSVIGLAEPHRRFHEVGRQLLRPLFRACFSMQQEGLANLCQSGPYILAANHVSMLDWAFLSYYLPGLVRFVVDREYYDHPVLGIALRFNGAVPVHTDRPDRAGLRMALSVLRAGEPLVLFPEGGISRNGRPRRAHPGIIALATAAQVPIIPAAIRGAFEAFPRWRRFPRTGRITVAFGTPLPPPSVHDRKSQRQLANDLMARITELLDGRPELAAR